MPNFGGGLAGKRRAGNTPSAVHYFSSWNKKMKMENKYLLLVFVLAADPR
jgi:hypothetical protein